MAILPYSLLLVMCSFQILLGIHLFYVSGQCVSDERLKLLQFKGGLNFDSANSAKLVHWNHSRNCCTWQGLSCDHFGHVISLELNNEMISLRTADWKSLFALQHLEKLNLAFNNFSSSIPSELCNLWRLKHLKLSNAGFVGQIPICLSRMKSLITLDLSSRFLAIEPLEAKNPGLKVLFGNLTELRELYLDRVNISAQGKDWCNALSSLSKLRVLSLVGCHLSGPLHSSLLKLRSLTVIQLNDNYLSTTVPDFFENFTNLTTLSLSSCNLNGYFPKKIFQVRSLQRLDLSNNWELVGNLPEFSQGGSLTEIVLRYTNFFGTLPISFGNVRQLSRIDLSNCNFSGPIPAAMINLSELVYLDLSFNNFNGSIPTFQTSKRLAHIDLSRNVLSGSISFAHFEGLVNLVFIDLAYNTLTGSIPPSLFALPSLQNLQLSNNKFDGELHEFPNVSSSFLRVLDFSNNSLSGILPACLLEMPELSVLNLGGNNLHGRIPDIFVDNCILSALDLSRNALEGVFPRSLGNCRSLQVVNVGHNNIEDIFPCLLMRESDLRVIILRSNKFHGELHCSWTNNSWKSLQIMDIAYNNFIGVLPQELFLNWKGMQDDSPLGTRDHLQYDLLKLSDLYHIDTVPLIVKAVECQVLKILIRTIDFSCNNFHGRMPDAVGQLNALCILNLSHNSLTGAIPKSIGNLTQLESLDLSMNQLRGYIPSELVNLTWLAYLNLSFNHLVGSIPPRGQFLTFSESSFQGNTGLCGFPLNISCPFKRQSAKNEIEWGYVSAALGFSVGLGIISWLNFFNPRWWQKFNALVLQLLLRILHRRIKQRTFRNPVRRL